MSVITRFAPSPTGILHTGGARTALFNYLFSKKHGGKFLLRIEDTDIERSKPEYEQAILHSLQWLGLLWDDGVVHQLSRINRHQEVVTELLQRKKAYYCYSTPQEIEEFRRHNAYGKFVSPWRDFNGQPPHDKPVVRLSAEQGGDSTLHDLIQGAITVANQEMDDMILLRSDGTPTYMLAVVVDDFDMKITHVIRGDDHLTNAFRQMQIYKAMNWPIPQFAHIPLIHDKEGQKLSKRNGALGIAEYQKLGYLPEAVCNHLLKLGWSAGDQEFFTIDEAIQAFSLQGVGKSPARFDIDKLNHINSYYLQHLSTHETIAQLKTFLPNTEEWFVSRIVKGMVSLKQRSSTLQDLANNAAIYFSKQNLDAKSMQVMAGIGEPLLERMLPLWQECMTWEEVELQTYGKEMAVRLECKPTDIMQTLRATVTGTFNSPGIYEVMAVLGKEEVINRLIASRNNTA